MIGKHQIKNGSTNVIGSALKSMKNVLVIGSYRKEVKGPNEMYFFCDKEHP